MHSYYLKGDHVGGSCECLIVNTAALAPNEIEDWTVAAITKKLSNRLNATNPGDWEAHPAVVYFSDMLPYLIRVACMFEGVGARYRIDPAKLISVIKSIL